MIRFLKAPRAFGWVGFAFASMSERSKDKGSRVHGRIGFFFRFLKERRVKVRGYAVLFFGGRNRGPGRGRGFYCVSLSKIRVEGPRTC